MGIFSERLKFHSTLQVIPRFGLNSHCFDLISKRGSWFEFTLVCLSHSKEICSLDLQCLLKIGEEGMSLFGLFRLTVILLWILERPGLTDQLLRHCFI